MKIEKQITNPQEELEFFKEKSLSNHAEAFKENFFDSSLKRQTETVRKNLERHPAQTQERLSYGSSPVQSEEVILSLSPDEDDKKMEELLGLVQESGLSTTLEAIEKTESYHIRDDLHRLLVQYLKGGFSMGIKERGPLQKALQMTLFEIYLPSSIQKGDQEKDLKTMLSFMEQFYAGMTSVSSGEGNKYFSLELALPRGSDEVVFYCAIPNPKINIFKNQLLSIFPEAKLFESKDDYNIFNKKEAISISNLSLEKSPLLPIKIYEEFAYDPLGIILKGFSNLEKDEGAAFQMIISPAEDTMAEKIRKAISKIEKGEKISDSLRLKENSFLSAGKSIYKTFSTKENKREVKDHEVRQLTNEELKKKNKSKIYRGNLRIIASGQDAQRSEAILSELEAGFYQFENPSGNKFKFQRAKGKETKREVRNFIYRIFQEKKSDLFNLSELTSLFHFPKMDTSSLGIVASRDYSSAGASLKATAVGKEHGSGPAVFQKKEKPQILPQSSTFPEQGATGAFSAPEEAFSPSAVLQAKVSQPAGSFPLGSVPPLGSPSVPSEPPLTGPQATSPHAGVRYVAPPVLEPLKGQTNQINQIGEQSRETASPQQIRGGESILLGENLHQGQSTPIYTKTEDRMKHFYVIGQTGTGKTNLLSKMIVQDIRAGDGVCFIDPHGSDVDEILANIPPERADDVIYFDPSYTPRPMGFNMLEYDKNKPEQKSFVVNELFSIFVKLYADNPESTGPMFEQYFRNATQLVLEDPDSGNTMIEISRVLSDADFRNMKLSRCGNEVVKQFWTKIAAQAGGEASLENIVPYITSKLDVFLSNDTMRPIIAQEHSAFNFREIMDSQKILLVNLSKGRLGEKNASLIGLILVGKILMAALSRVDMPKEQIRPFYLYIDEFQNISTPSISQILSEARKYKLSLNIAHQNIDQLDEHIRNSVFGNVGSMAIFRVSPQDAEFLEKYLTPTFSAFDIINLENYNAYLKYLVKGEPQKPFNIKVLPPEEGNPALREKLKELSYLKYGKNREEVEANIRAKFRSFA